MWRHRGPHVAGPHEPEGEVRGGGEVAGAGEMSPQTTVTWDNIVNIRGHHGDNMTPILNELFIIVIIIKKYVIANCLLP